MQLSIKNASHFMIGAAIIRDMANKSEPKSSISFRSVAAMASREDEDGQNLRLSIDKIALQEDAWFRRSLSHTLATERVIQTRANEVRTLNSLNLAALATLEFNAKTATNAPYSKEALQTHLQTAVRAIDELGWSTSERRALLQLLKSETNFAHDNSDFITQELKIAQKAYLEKFREERLSAYIELSLDRSNNYRIA